MNAPPSPHRPRACRAECEVQELRVHSRSPQRCNEPPTLLEKRIVRACTRPAELRSSHEVGWIASQLRKIPAFQNVPGWKLESLGRNMSVIFASQGADAGVLCSDPNCSYFLFSGSLVPIDSAIAETVLPMATAPLHENNQLRWFDVENAPTRRHEATGLQQATSSRREGDAKQSDHHPAACGSGALAGLASPMHGLWVDSPCDVSDTGISHSVGSSRSPAHETPINDKPEAVERGNDNHNSRGDINSASLCSLHPPTFFEICGELSASDAGTGCLLQPGHALDMYLHTKDVSGKGLNVNGVDEGRDEALLPESRSTVAGADKNDTGLRWRLDARHAACIGKISHWLLQELESEEPLREIEQMVTFLRSTEVFREGFSHQVLRKLAVVMEHQEQREASVVVRKGSTVEKVVMVVSGEAIRLGDSRTDSAKSPTSLRIRAGQIYGAEEVMSGLPYYTSNLVATTLLRFCTIPGIAFLEAIDGVCTEVLKRLASKARIASHDVHMGASSAGHRPFTAEGVDGERSVSRNRSRYYCVHSLRGEEGDGPLRVLAPSETPHSPVALSPMPFFSAQAARGYMRVTGTCTETDPAERMNVMAAVWTPWAWRPPAREKAYSPSSRPRSAPATAKGPAAVALHHMARQRQRPTCDPQTESPPGSGSFPSLHYRSGKGTGTSRGPRRLEASTSRGGGVVERFAASADSKRLGLLSGSCSATRLVGCEGAALPVDPSSRSSASGCSVFRPETLMKTTVRTPPPRSGGRRHHRRPTVARPTCEERRSSSTAESIGSFGRIHAHRAANSKVGSVRSSNRGGGRTKEEATSDLSRVLLTTPCPSLSTPSTASATGTSIAATLKLWSHRELAEAERAVCSRFQRKAICRAFSARQGVAAGMAAAQRAHRGAYVMSRMGDAKARSQWRPFSGEPRGAVTSGNELLRTTSTTSGGAAVVPFGVGVQ